MKINVASRISTIKYVLAKRNYKLLLALLVITYLTINVLINQFYVTLPVFLSFRLSLTIPYILLSIGTGIVAALNITLVIYKFKQVTAIKREAGTASVGIFGGLLGGACPGCFVGLFPTLTGVFGTSLTLSALPFLGFEIAIPAFLLSLIALYIISNPLTCKIKEK